MYYINECKNYSKVILNYISRVHKINTYFYDPSGKALIIGHRVYKTGTWYKGNCLSSKMRIRGRIGSFLLNKRKGLILSVDHLRILNSFYNKIGVNRIEFITPLVLPLLDQSLDQHCPISMISLK